MKREIIQTGDASHTLYIPALDEHYHSVHGAVRESRHVFIEAGLRFHGENKTPLRILEMGFGTGLNALLTLLETAPGQQVIYTSIESFPLAREEWGALNYCDFLPDGRAYFSRLHEAAWGVPVEIRPGFILRKYHGRLEEFEGDGVYDCMYYDAFAPRVQPELWTAEVFKRLFGLIAAGGCLVTYCAKGDVKRALKSAGFTVETLPGPPGKREMTRALRGYAP